MKNKNILLKLLVFCVISFSSNKSFTQNTEKDSLLKANNFLKVFIPDKSFVSEKMQCYKVAPELNVTISDVLKYKKEFLGLSDDDELILQELTDERQFGSGGNGKAYSQFYKGYFVNNAYIAITTNKQKQVTFIVNQLVKNINIDTKNVASIEQTFKKFVTERSMPDSISSSCKINKVKRKIYPVKLYKTNSSDYFIGCKFVFSDSTYMIDAKSGELMFSASSRAHVL